MSLQIDIALTDNTGRSVAASSVLTYNPIFVGREKRATIPLKLWKDAASVDVDESISGVQEFNLGLELTFTKAELLSLTLPALETKVQDAIEALIGAGNTTIVDLIPEDV